MGGDLLYDQTKFWSQVRQAKALKVTTEPATKGRVVLHIGIATHYLTPDEARTAARSLLQGADAVDPKQAGQYEREAQARTMLREGNGVS
jgi:hypothetical protein